MGHKSSVKYLFFYSKISKVDSRRLELTVIMYCVCRNENPYEKTRTRFTVGWILFTHGSVFNTIFDIVPYQSRSGKFLLIVEKIQEDSPDSIPSPSPTVKIQIIAREVYLR